MALSTKIGITKTTLSRWTLPLNFRAHISAQTRQMLNVGDGNAILHSEATPAKIKTQRDNSVQNNIVRIQAIVLAWKSLDSHSCIHLMKKGW